MKLNLLVILICISFLSISFPGPVAGQYNHALTVYETKIMYVPSLTDDISIDGVPDEGVWSMAARFSPFAQTAGNHTGKMAEYETECFIFYRENRIYLAFICHEKEMANLQADAVWYDDPDIIYDDRVSVFIDAGHDHQNFYELTVNPAGKQFDQAVFLRYPKTRTNNTYPEWNCDWKARTSAGENFWTAEMEIDVTSLGIGRLTGGTTVGFNVARVRQPGMVKGRESTRPAPGAEYSAWAFTVDGIWETVGNFYEPIEFNDLTFGQIKVPLQRLKFRNASFIFGGNTVQPSLTGFNPVEMEFDPSLPLPANWEVSLTTLSKSGKSWETVTPLRLAENHVFKSEYFIRESGESILTLRIRDKDSGSILYSVSYVLTVPPFIDFELMALYSLTPDNTKPVGYRLLSDTLTLQRSVLELELLNETGNSLYAEMIDDPLSGRDFNKFYDTEAFRLLPAGNYAISCLLRDKVSRDTISHFVQHFTKNPSGPDNSFKAVEGDYQYGGLKGNAILVGFPNGERFVFWDKASYVPWWDVGQVAVTYEFVESNGFSTQGCTEPMQDRECRYSYVRIVEQSDARIVVHWRYALTDAHYRLHNNEWVDEYYYLYPDAVGVRDVHLWANGNEVHEFFEIIPVQPPGMQVSDMFGDYVAELTNLDGQSYTTNDFNQHDLAFHRDFLSGGKDFLVRVNLKDRRHPFAVFTYRDSVNPGLDHNYITLCRPQDYLRSSHRGHWPASEYAIDGYNLIGNHRPSHGNIGNIKKPVSSGSNPNTFTMLMGISDGDNAAASRHARSWLNPLTVTTEKKSAIYNGYDFRQRAYLLQCSGSGTIRLRLTAAGEAILNPVFILNNPPVTTIRSVVLGGKKLSEGDFRCGTGKNGQVILFLNRQIEGNIQLEVQF